MGTEGLFVLFGPFLSTFTEWNGMIAYPCGTGEVGQRACLPAFTAVGLARDQVGAPTLIRPPS